MNINWCATGTLPESILILTDLILIICIIKIIFIEDFRIRFIKQIGLVSSFIIFFLTIWLYILFNTEKSAFYFRKNLEWSFIFNIYYSIGIDGISLFFLILTTLLVPICMLISWNSIKYRVKEFTILILFTELMLINVFSTLDLLLFYIYFESILIPMFMLIGLWGSRQRKIHAVYQFFFYTLFGSIIMLIGILFIYYLTGTTDIQILNNKFLIPKEFQLFLWITFFASFSIKIPMMPVHIWLPEAHVEAPTAGSVLLAGVLLKLGTYGIIRFMLPMFPDATIFFTPVIFTLCTLAVVYSSLTTISQIDLKKIIAYSSVAHMNFGLLGLFTSDTMGLGGNMYLMLGHGLVSSGLFLCIGILYDRYHTRNILYYGGLIQTMPVFGITFLIFTLANIAFPCSVNFIGEFLILLSILKSNTWITILAGSSIILGAIYSIWLFNRILFGKNNKSLRLFTDINRREFLLLLPLVILTLSTGLYASPALKTIIISLNFL